MQPRLQRSKSGGPFLRVIIKFVLALLFIFICLFFVEKIDFPSPQKEIIEDVTNKIEKIK
tara:strand:- start:7822 stop:8001 length:180 start_codon:yes stop_codon:yes gene_type:complete